MEAMNLEILRLHPMQNYGTPYDYDVDGFNENGWHSSFIIETTKQQKEVENESSWSCSSSYGCRRSTYSVGY